MSEREIEEALRAKDDAVAAEDHLDDETIAARAERGAPLTEAERTHLSRCAECREVYGHLLRTKPAGVVPIKYRAVAFALAAALAAFGLWRIIPADTDRHGVKGESIELAAEVGLIATSSAGVRRDLENNARLRPSDRLGFRYGNPKNQHRTLAIVAWDGKNVHAYHPASLESAALVIEGGPRALAKRLSEDVELSDHATGNLRVVAAFDVSPKDIAAAIKSPSLAKRPGWFVFDLRLESTP